MQKLVIFTYKEKQPKLRQEIVRIISGFNNKILHGDSLINSYPKNRFSSEPPYPEPIITWTSGKKPNPNDLWGYYEHEEGFIKKDTYRCEIDFIDDIVDCICLDEKDNFFHLYLEKNLFPKNFDLKKEKRFIYKETRNNMGELIKEEFIDEYWEVKNETTS